MIVKLSIFLFLSVVLIASCNSSSTEETSIAAIEIIVPNSGSVIVSGKEIAIEDFEKEFTRVFKIVLKKVPADTTYTVNLKVAEDVKMRYITEVMTVLKKIDKLKVVYSVYRSPAQS